MGDYTVLAIVAPTAVIMFELLVLRTGLLRRLRFWITMGIVLGFQVPVDGWLTKPDASVVVYDPAAKSGIRMPWNIPVEDFGFGFAMVALTLLLWQWWQRRDRERPQRVTRAEASAGGADA
jgi:lycopene cyclase domain-containing protein